MLLNLTTAIVRYKWRWENRFIGRSMLYPGTIGGAVPISSSGNRATRCTLYVTSNNKLRRHSRKMFSVDSCQFPSGQCHFSDSQKSRLNRDMEEKGIVAVCGIPTGSAAPAAEQPLGGAYGNNPFLLHVAVQSVQSVHRE